IDSLRERHPFQTDVRLLILTGECVRSRLYAGGEIDADQFAVAAGSRPRRHERLPVACDEICLLGQLALRGEHRILALDVVEYRWKLPVTVPDRMPVLLDEQTTAIIVEREDGDGSGVIDVLADDLPIAVGDAVRTHVPH